jgi:hypothetical protein
LETDMSLWSELRRTTFVSSGRVVAHILDPITGYSNRDLQVGKDIDADTVRRLGDNGAVFIVVDYAGGTPTATVCKRAQWLRAQAQQRAAETGLDTTVWGKRQELEIG